MSKESIKNIIFLIMGSLMTSIMLTIYMAGNNQAVAAGLNEAPDNAIKFMGTLISILLVIIGFFIVYYFNQQSGAYKELTLAIGELRVEIAKRTQWEESFEDKYKEHRTNCDDKYVKK
jgi:hypothetical protein